MVDPVTVDVGLDTSERPQLFAFEWHEDSIAWYINDTELFRIDDAAEVPLPPGKIYFDLWAGAAKQAGWAGEAAPDATGYAMIQCVSFVAQNLPSPQCSDLTTGD
jgi:beta-glucanase (GH16 family)